MTNTETNTVSRIGPVPAPQELVLTADRSKRTRELPFEKSRAVERIVALIGKDADRFTDRVVATLAAQLPMSSLAKVRESLETRRPRNRAAYAVGALKSELEEQTPCARFS
jgi:hypothetical protein